MSTSEPGDLPFPGSRIAAELGRARDSVASTVTEAFLARHPDWIARYGDRARTDGMADAGHHIDFLQAAVELHDAAVFIDYALWCRDLLSSRGISAATLIENLEAIHDELAAQLSPPAAAAVGRATRAGIEALAAGKASPGAHGDKLSPACRLYLAASISGLRKDALAIVREAVRGGESLVDVYVDVFQSALYEVGRRWQTTELTIAEEHMATATTQFILSVLHDEHVRNGRSRGTAVVTGVVDEQHVVGASIVANVLDAAGWDVRFMGTNLPHDATVAGIVECQASLVAISVTMSRGVAHARDLIAHIRQSNANPPRIIVGGAAFNRDPSLWRSIGADAFATDARSVVELAHG